MIAFHCCIVGRRESGLHRPPRPQELLYGGRVHVDAMWGYVSMSKVTTILIFSDFPKIWMIKFSIQIVFLYIPITKTVLVMIENLLTRKYVDPLYLVFLCTKDGFYFFFVIFASVTVTNMLFCWSLNSNKAITENLVIYIFSDMYSMHIWSSVTAALSYILRSLPQSNIYFLRILYVLVDY